MIAQQPYSETYHAVVSVTSSLYSNEEAPRPLSPKGKHTCVKEAPAPFPLIKSQPTCVAYLSVHLDPTLQRQDPTLQRNDEGSGNLPKLIGFRRVAVDIASFAKISVLAVQPL